MKIILTITRGKRYNDAEHETYTADGQWQFVTARYYDELGEK